MKLLKCRVYKKEATTKDGKKFDKFFIAFVNKNGERATMDCTFSREASRDSYTLFGKDKHFDCELAIGNAKGDYKTQDGFIKEKVNKTTGQYVLNKNGERIKQLVIVKIGIENLIKDLELPELEHKDLTEDW